MCVKPDTVREINGDLKTEVSVPLRGDVCQTAQVVAGPNGEKLRASFRPLTGRCVSNGLQQLRLEPDYIRFRPLTGRCVSNCCPGDGSHHGGPPVSVPLRGDVCQTQTPEIVPV